MQSGVLEYWSVGVLKICSLLQYSNTPSLLLLNGKKLCSLQQYFLSIGHSRFREGLLQVPDNIIHMLDADGQANQIRG